MCSHTWEKMCEVLRSKQGVWVLNYKWKNRKKLIFRLHRFWIDSNEVSLISILHEIYKSMRNFSCWFNGTSLFSHSNIVVWWRVFQVRDLRHKIFTKKISIIFFFNQCSEYFFECFYRSQIRPKWATAKKKVFPNQKFVKHVKNVLRSMLYEMISFT
jgi:hypothetical protein